MKHIAITVLISLTGFGWYIANPQFTAEALGGFVAGVSMTALFLYGMEV